MPITPDFAELLADVPDCLHTGRVFDTTARQTGKPMSQKRVGKVVSEIGETAEVVVNSRQGKHASAHDLRRSFGTRWAAKVKPATLGLLMRHRSIETTMKYYVEQDADEIADELWAADP